MVYFRQVMIMRKSEAVKARIKWRKEVKALAKQKEYPKRFFSIAIRHDLGHNQDKWRKQPINKLVRKRIVRYRVGGVPIRLHKA